MSRYLSAYCAALWDEATAALRCWSCVVNRMRTSNGSAMFAIVAGCFCFSSTRGVVGIKDCDDSLLIGCT